jgi:hypothetical protein
MLRILGRGRSVPTVTELIFVGVQSFTNFAIKAIYAWRTGTGYGKVGKTLSSHIIGRRIKKGESRGEKNSRLYLIDKARAKENEKDVTRKL